MNGFGVLQKWYAYREEHYWAIYILCLPVICVCGDWFPNQNLDNVVKELEFFYLCIYLFIKKMFLAACETSPTRGTKEQICTSCSGSTVLTTEPQGKSLNLFLTKVLQRFKKEIMFIYLVIYLLKKYCFKVSTWLFSFSFPTQSCYVSIRNMFYTWGKQDLEKLLDLTMVKGYKRLTDLLA